MSAPKTLKLPPKLTILATCLAGTEKSFQLMLDRVDG